MAPQEVLEDGGTVDAPSSTCDSKDEGIPIVDVGPWVSPDGSEEDKNRVSKDVFEAFCTIGFVIVVNHGVKGDGVEGETGTTAKAFSESQKFFCFPKEEKMKSAYKDPASNRGYISMGQELLDAQLPDIKESFDIGFEGEQEFKNEWPEQLEDFREAMLETFSEYDKLHLTILRALARGMGLEDDYFTPLCNGNHQNLRLLHYPECDREAITKTGQKRGGIHTDYGTITLVSQQKVSGLVAQRLDGSWASVPPTPGGIVVNVGEMLQRWSNDILRATPHQILDDDPLSPETEKSAIVPERYSIAFFCNANKETSLECLPVCHSPERPPKYEPINAHDYITMRLTQTIPVAKTADPLSTTIAGISLDKCLLNSSNPYATSLANLQELADSPSSGAVTTRTACPNFVHDDGVHQWRNWGTATKTDNTINCLGYSCNSFEYYINSIRNLKTSKPIVMSVSGYAAEVAEMLAQVAQAFPPKQNSPVVLVEINLSCPNIPGKPPIAYDFEGMQEYLSGVFCEGDHGLKVGVKLTPYFYEDQFLLASKTINSFKDQIAFVTTINTVGCGLVVDVETESPILWNATSGASSGFGGLGGPAVRATALGNVRRLRQLLDPSIDLIGCGGVDSGEAAFSHLLCGATAVMAASALLTHGVGIFEKIEGELLQIMKEKGYTSVEDFRGKLKDGWQG